MTLNPSFSRGEAKLGDIYSRRGNNELAAQYYVEAVEAFPENYEAQDRLAAMLVSEGRYADAIPHLEIAAKNPRSDADADYMLGTLLVEQKRWLEGIPYLQRAVQLDPNRKDALTGLGLALQAEGEIQEAAASFAGRCRSILNTFPQKKILPRWNTSWVQPGGNDSDKPRIERIESVQSVQSVAYQLLVPTRS